MKINIIYLELQLKLFVCQIGVKNVNLPLVN